MITHYIILSSSYSMGKRIALHYIFKEESYAKLKKVVPRIVKECGRDVSISTHFIETDLESWEAVVFKDHFFKEVEVIGTIEEFTELIQKDRTLKGLDVAKYIFSKVKCTHLKLEKLVYLCFTDYLCKYDKALYKDIYIGIDTTGIHELPSRSRILFAEDGIKKIKSIDDTISKYGHLSSKTLECFV